MHKILFLCLALLSPLLVQAQQTFSPIEGKHYRVLKKTISGQTGSQLFFWYGCKSCAQILAFAEEQYPHWKKVPVAIYKQWRPQSKLYYTLRNLELPFSVDQQLMTALHKGVLSTADFVSQKTLVMGDEIKTEDFDRHFYSKTVNQQTNNAETLKRKLKLSKVPAMLIGGQFYVDLSMVKNLQQFTQTALYLERLSEKKQPTNNAASTLP